MHVCVCVYGGYIVFTITIQKSVADYCVVCMFRYCENHIISHVITPDCV